MCDTVHRAGLKYVVYTWVHFPPVWLRDQQKQNRTLMRCLEHDQETNYLSIFDPKTIEHYDHFYKRFRNISGTRSTASTPASSDRMAKAITRSTSPTGSTSATATRDTGAATS